MCITFFHTSSGRSLNGFRLVLAFNRDEVLNRTTDPLRWDMDGTVLCGRDLTPGKEGGTWLAVSKKGRVGLLTNISTGIFGEKGKGRGRIVLDFLERHDVKPMDYLEAIDATDDAYNPFNACLFEPNSDGYDVFSYTRGKPGHSVKSEPPKAWNVDGNIYGLSNHPVSKPFKKTDFGAGLVRGVLESRQWKADQASELIDQLASVMLSREKCLPDEQMLSQCNGDEAFVSDLASVFVDAPGRTYGTRMQSFILIDHDGNVTFEERTLDQSDGNTNWKTIRECFTIDN